MRLLLVMATVVLAFGGTSSCELLATVEAKSTESKSFALSDPTALEFTLSNTNGRVEVTGEAERTTVELEIEKIAYGVTSQEAQERLQAIKVIAAQNGDAVSIRTELPKILPSGRSAQVYYTVHVPQSLKAIALDSVNGWVEAKNISTSEKTSLGTINGNITFKGAAPQIELSSTNGRVELSGQGSAKLSTVNGSVSGDLTNGEIEASTTNGSISLALDAIRQGQIEAVNGLIRLTLTHVHDLQVIAESGHGSVELSGFDRVERTMDVSGGRARGLLGPGSQMLRLSTSNGRIRVDVQRELP